MFHRINLPDGRPTTAEWPVKIWSVEEIPEVFKEQACAWIKEDFSQYLFVYSPKRRTDASSYSYLYGYGKDRIFYLGEAEGQRESGEIVQKEICREQIFEVSTSRELLSAKILLHYQEEGEEKILAFPYVPSVYYLYDPFLNWLLGLKGDFMPYLAERNNPRPEKLYRESLVMYNYSLAAYRLGDGFQDYRYEAEVRRRKWMPWKKEREEWLKIPMERGEFELHSLGYLTECFYHIGQGADAHMEGEGHGKRFGKSFCHAE